MTLHLVPAEPPADADQQALRDRLDSWNVTVTGRITSRLVGKRRHVLDSRSDRNLVDVADPL